ncbi:uncharacterized protein LOC110630216 isoform X1 [Manihot esculenta]|uniref:uncharacterized protein LOC110630216 isoform X1 n=1 Tax=Manihot esculenta TaxID=3983 RepID=UPI001CC4388E|nr:uncharacterized protein LOC110630216 isoform X1 [Manihot esculenta]
MIGTIMYFAIDWCLLGLLLRLTFIACHSSFPVMKESFIFLISSFLLNRSTNSTLLWAGYVSILFLNPEITTAAFLASSGSSITNDSFQQVRVSWIHGLDLSVGFRLWLSVYLFYFLGPRNLLLMDKYIYIDCWVLQCRVKLRFGNSQKNTQSEYLTLRLRE